MLNNKINGICHSNYVHIYIKHYLHALPILLRRAQKVLRDSHSCSMFSFMNCLIIRNMYLYMVLHIRYQLILQKIIYIYENIFKINKRQKKCFTYFLFHFRVLNHSLQVLNTDVNIYLIQVVFTSQSVIFKIINDNEELRYLGPSVFKISVPLVLLYCNKVAHFWFSTFLALELTN